MPCGRHMVHYDDCRPCRDTEARFDAERRHKAQMRQAQRHHDQRMNARRVGTAGLAAAGSAAGSAGIGLAGIVLVVVLVIFAVMAAVVITVLSVASSVLTLLVQGVFAAVFFGGVASVVTYAIKRVNAPAARLTFQKPDAGRPAKQRAVAAYRGLDPVTRSAVRVGGIVAAAAFVLSVVF